jgi:branched-subunit amino acid transport protein
VTCVNAMRVVVAILGVGAVTFMLRVLLALVKDRKSLLPGAMEVHFAKFIPPKKQGELIVMNPEAGKRKLPIKAGKRAALVALLAAGLTLPVHSQQTANGGADSRAGQSESRPGAMQPVPIEVLQEHGFRGDDSVEIHLLFGGASDEETAFEAVNSRFLPAVGMTSCGKRR